MRRIEFTPTQAVEPATVSGIEQRTALQTHQRQRRSVRLSGPRGSCFLSISEPTALRRGPVPAAQRDPARPRSEFCEEEFHVEADSKE